MYYATKTSLNKNDGIVRGLFRKHFKCFYNNNNKKKKQNICKSKCNKKTNKNGLKCIQNCKNLSKTNKQKKN